MITKTDAIAIGKAIVLAAKREKENNFDEMNARYICNGVASYALDNLWYDVLPLKVKEKFNYSVEEYKNTVWSFLE